jgi:hypothetical protein
MAHNTRRGLTFFLSLALVTILALAPDVLADGAFGAANVAQVRQHGRMIRRQLPNPFGGASPTPTTSAPAQPAPSGQTSTTTSTTSTTSEVSFWRFCHFWLLYGHRPNDEYIHLPEFLGRVHVVPLRWVYHNDHFHYDIYLHRLHLLAQQHHFDDINVNYFHQHQHFHQYELHP